MKGVHETPSGLLPATVKSIKNIMKPTVGKLSVKFAQSVILMKKMNHLIMQNGFDMVLIKNVTNKKSFPVFLAHLKHKVVLNTYV